MGKLIDYIEYIIDNRGKNPKYLEQGEYFVIDNGIIQNELYPNLNHVTRFIDSSTHNSFLRGYLEKDTPIMTLVGNGIGNVTLAPGPHTVIVQNTIGFKTKTSLNKIYLYYYLLANQKRIRNFNRGSGQPSVKRTDILNLEVEFPDINTQNRIASILYKLDKKIENNKRINDNLLQQVMTIFNGRFNNSNDGEHSISEYLLPKRGKGLLSKDAIFGSVPVVAGGLEPATYHNQSNTDNPVITISASGANAGYIRLWNQKVWSSDSSYIDSSVTEYVYFWFALLKSRQQEIFDSQTGSAQPHIYPQHIGALKIPKLNIEEVKIFNEDVSSIFELIGQNEVENKNLVKIRNTLLPKLMNGEINLSNIEID